MAEECNRPTERKVGLLNAKSMEDFSSRACPSPDLPHMKPTQRKRRRLSTLKPEIESSSDSFSHSNYIASDGEGSSDSDFEEHAYSRSPHHFGKLGNNAKKPKIKSDSITLSQFVTNSKQNKRSKCTSKNAVMARINRQKKKEYIENLESKNEELEAENQMLRNMLDVRAKEVETLKRKTLNLESVIRNKTEIGSLLKCVREHTDLEISSSLVRSTNIKADDNSSAGNPSLSNLNEVPLSEEEALIAAVLWGMALHTFCQPCKLRTSTSLANNCRHLNLTLAET